MKDSVLKIFDELAEDYHLIFVDWHLAIERQSEILNNVIQLKLHVSSTHNVSLLRLLMRHWYTSSRISSTLV